MRWMHKFVALPAALGLAALLAGCPAPVLRVSPAAVNFTANQTTADVMVHNDGAGALTWQVEENLPWLSLEGVDKDSAEGTVTTSPSVVVLSVNRAGLPVGVTRGDITFTSNGGIRTLPVSVDVGGPAQLQVFTNTLDFGTSSTQQSFVITNTGLEPLTWSLSIPATAPWLTAGPASGTIQSRNGTQTVTITANRRLLSPGPHPATITVNSNGGQAAIDTAISVVPFTVSPESLPYGAIQQSSTKSFTVRNTGNVVLAANYSVNTNATGNWLSVARSQDVIAVGAPASLEVTVNPAGLAPGDYSGSVNVTAAGATVSVPVTFSVTSLTVSPSELDFGQVQNGQTSGLSQTFQVSRQGDTAIAYNVVVPAAAQAWLSVTPGGPNTVSAPITHTVTINPDAIPSGPQSVNIGIVFEGGSETVTVEVVKLRPARLVVVSQDVNLGTTGLEQRIDIWNDGIGTVNWSIDTSGFPAWLSLQGATSGSVTGDETDTVTIRVDRSLAPANVFDLTHTFQVVASGDATGSLPVTVSATIPQVPRIEVVGQAVDDDGVPFINIDIENVTATFIVRNTGNGVLNWFITPAQVPAWITSISPSQGGLNPNTEQSVTVTVDRSSLDYRGAQVELLIGSNDPTVEGGVVPFIVEVQVPKKVAITARPDAIAFGADENVATLEIANSGDAGTILTYRIRSTKENFLKVFPETGSSVGTDAALKDFKTHFVSIVRSELDGNGSSGKLIVEAIRTNDAGQIEVIPDVAPLEITISVEAAKLTFENAIPRLRTPSIARFVLLMRNLRYAPIALPDTRLKQLANQFQIFENDEPVDLDESARVVKPNSFIRGNLLITLDYSRSMQEAARKVADPTISGAPDPLQALYERTISSLIDEIPANYRVGIAVFSDRDGNVSTLDALRPIYGGATEDPELADDLFITNRAAVKERLNNIFVATNGATELYPALIQAARQIWQEDNFVGIVPFDDADDRIILCVTDGRATTPPGEVTDAIASLQRDYRTRALVIGWGNDVSTGPLVLLTTETGGHIYATQNQRVTTGGVTTTIPVVEELQEYCETIAADPCDLSVKRDLESQYLLSYVSLNEEGSVNIEGRLAFDDPNDQLSPCLAEQGVVEGKFQGEQTPLGLFAGDPRMSQIKLDYSGLQPDGTGRVLVYLDAASRDISRLQLQFTPVNASLVPADITVVPATQGGVVGNWTVTNTGLTYTLQSPDGTPLTYGDFGPLLSLTLRNIDPFDGRLDFDVLDPVYSAGDPNTRFFIYPDSVPLTTPQRFLAPAFPFPSFRLVGINGGGTGGRQLERLADGSLFLDLGSDVDTFRLEFSNLGGSHEPTSKGLQIIIAPNAQGLVVQPDTVATADWENVFVYGTQDTEVRDFVVLRDSLLGEIDGRDAADSFEIDYNYVFTQLGYSGEMQPLILRIAP